MQANGICRNHHKYDHVYLSLVLNANLYVADEDYSTGTVAEQIAEIVSTGEITVKVHRRSKGKRSNKIDCSDMLGLDSSKTINERALKGSTKSHGAK